MKADLDQAEPAGAEGDDVAGLEVEKVRGVTRLIDRHEDRRPIAGAGRSEDERHDLTWTSARRQ